MDFETIQILLTKMVIFTPIVTGVVQAFKLAGFPTNFLPFVSMGLGAAVGWFFVSMDPTGIFIGVGIGLSAVGLYEGISQGKQITHDIVEG